MKEILENIKNLQEIVQSKLDYHMFFWHNVPTCI